MQQNFSGVNFTCNKQIRKYFSERIGINFASPNICQNKIKPNWFYDVWNYIYIYMFKGYQTLTSKDSYVITENGNK